MTVQLRVPKARAEKPRGGREFPEGLWLMELEAVTTREIDPAANPKLQWMFNENDKGNKRYAGATAETLGIQFGQAEALEEEQDEAGNQKLFVDLTLRDGTTYIDEVGEDARGVGYQISIDGSLFTNLALALKQAYEEDGYYQPTDDFRDQLASGAFVGVQVKVKVFHRHYTSAAGRLQRAWRWSTSLLPTTSRRCCSTLPATRQHCPTHRCWCVGYVLATTLEIL